MLKILISIVIIFVLSLNSASPQDFDDKKSNFNQDFSKKELTEKILNKSISDLSFDENRLLINDKKSTKSPGLAFIYSLILPGSGHFYTDRMEVGKYFVAAELTSWLGILGLTLHGDALQDDARTYASIHSAFNKEGKDDIYFRNVGEFNNIYEYNDDKLRRGEYELIYDVNEYFWNWDNSTNREKYDSDRRHSERVYDSRIIFATGLIINRITSAISALILTNRHNSDILSSLKINSEFIGTRDNPFDGIKLNLVKEF
jgi:hypothetical protein